MAKMTIDIMITSNGQVKTEVIDGHQGAKCVEILSGLAAFLGQPSGGHLKPEFEEDPEALALMRQIGVMS